MKTILNTQFVQINLVRGQYQLLIFAQDGSVIEHEPFPESVEGLVTALQIATEICAGKFFLRGIRKDELLSINAPKKGRLL